MITLGSSTNNQLNVEPSNLHMLMNYSGQLEKEDFLSGSSPKH